MKKQSLDLPYARSLYNERKLLLSYSGESLYTRCSVAKDLPPAYSQVRNVLVIIPAYSSADKPRRTNRWPTGSSCKKALPKPLDRLRRAAVHKSLQLIDI